MSRHGMDELYHGAKHSREKILESKELKTHFDALAKGQQPKYYVIACSDSRVSPPEIFRMKAGSMFEMQQLGALMPAVPAKMPEKLEDPIDSEWANVAYAVEELRVQHLIVLGHTGCGAVAGIMSPEKIAHNKRVASHLFKHREIADRVEEAFGQLPEDQRALAAVSESVLETLQKVNAFAPVRRAVEGGHLKVHGMVYEINNQGAVSFWDDTQGDFLPINAERSVLPRRRIKSHS